jgi:3-oxoacyl-[acyl-carrier protein] reductase
MKNHNKTALVIGGKGDIGQAVVRRLSNDGFNVYATYYNKPLKQKIENINYIKCDVTIDQNIKNMIDTVIKKNNSIDAIVFTITPPIENVGVLDIKINDIEQHFQIQVMSVIKVISLLKEQFQKKYKTKIIVILTEYCIGKPPKGLTPYIIGKYALLGLSKVLAIELAEYNSTVNMLSPGMVDTKLIENLPSKLIEMTAYKNPLKRIASTNDIANVISFLASEESDYINGVNIPVNGGNIIL